MWFQNGKMGTWWISLDEFLVFLAEFLWLYGIEMEEIWFPGYMKRGVPIFESYNSGIRLSSAWTWMNEYMDMLIYLSYFWHENLWNRCLLRMNFCVRGVYVFDEWKLGIFENWLFGLISGQQDRGRVIGPPGLCHYWWAAILLLEPSPQTVTPIQISYSW